MKRSLPPFTVVVLLLQIFGCSGDPLSTHKIKTNFFDGVPDLPPLDVLCEDNMEELFNTYYQDRLAESTSGNIEEERKIVRGSVHPPYDEKNCKGCHDFEQKNMLIAPKDELCETCHVDFVQGNYVHGPVAVRDCLACHLPHSSENKSLLKMSLSGICDKCHHEDRLAAGMHYAVIEHNMDCVNCHNAHGSDKVYFLK
jgi:predicted CXXCH cytochrome family protein